MEVNCLCIHQHLVVCMLLSKRNS